MRRNASTGPALPGRVRATAFRRLLQGGWMGAALLSPAAPILLAEEDPRPVAGIMDNSFLVEEAYNQESGVIQHILTVIHRVDRVPGPDDRGWNPAFTQEWPLGGQRHQLSYTVPYAFSESGGARKDGWGDVLVNYRYQAYYDPIHLRGLAPRLSLILPTGDAGKGFGDDAVGFQGNVPFSTALGRRWSVNANAGLSYLPNAGVGVKHDLLDYNLGASAIFAASRNFHLMMEWIGEWTAVPGSGGGLGREFSAVISPGARWAINFAAGPQLVLGVGAPLGLTRAAPDFGVCFYLSFEHRLTRRKP